ncbi:metallophosphoesterase [Blastococcus sp. BMG 814]|uniref:Metallophosphoesterase n=1 Tax=Blastococcus carthaginiensis TaxID=3050034 RepID=A0ABT9IGK1_9ACTN|nr:metallophosphoesterase [Blastococcus carthaginiensis]MDP5184702.1 metallophosphoesterase [Blastococcus carthaginiensis]
MRFSDYEADTIAEHEQVLAQHGEVWWAWWKKLHEDWPAIDLGRLLAAVSSTGAASVGLLDRPTNRFFTANCSAVVHHQGEPVATPDVATTPAYYHDRLFPAWLKFTAISSMSEAQWTAQFGPVPTGDDTLFPVTDAANATQVFGRPCHSGGTGILHISDLHFGSDHGFSAHAHGIRSTKSLSSLIKGAIPQAPAAVVVSGDLTTRGEAEGLTNARTFLERLADDLDVPRDAVVIAPGNHDILVEDPKLTRDFSNEQPFRDFVHLFYGRQTDLERVHYIRGGDGYTYLIGSVNSSRPRNRKTMDYGYVGADRSEPVLRTISQLMHSLPTGSKVWSGLVLHHHVLPAPLFESPEEDRPVSLTLDAGELVSLSQAHGLDAILHGHQHLPFLGHVGRVAECGPVASPATKRAPIAVLGAGSTSVKVNRLPNEMRDNSFAFYQPSEEGLSARVFQFNPGKEPQALWSVLL